MKINNKFLEFFILCVVSGCFLLGFFLLKEPEQNRFDEEEIINESEEIKEIITYVNTCLKQTITDAVFLLGEQGMIFPEQYLEDISYNRSKKIVYFYYKKDILLPNKEDFFDEIETDISKYVTEKMRNCDMSFFEHELTTHYENIEAFSKIENGKLNVKIIYPVEVKIEGETNIIKNFESEFDLELENIYKEIEIICLETELHEKKIERQIIPDKLRTVSVEIANDLFIYKITKENAFNNQTLEYKFAVKI